MTFPLMSAGLIRRYPAAPGESLAMLYFTNSFGAAIGVLASGFVLIEALGLPGTIQVAGALNLALAAVVWTLAQGARAGRRRRPDRLRRRAALPLLPRGGAAHRSGLVRVRDRLDPDAVARSRSVHALVRADALGFHPRHRLRRLLGAPAHRLDRRPDAFPRPGAHDDGPARARDAAALRPDVRTDAGGDRGPRADRRRLRALSRRQPRHRARRDVSRRPSARG